MFTLHSRMSPPITVELIINGKGHSNGSGTNAAILIIRKKQYKNCFLRHS